MQEFTTIGSYSSFYITWVLLEINATPPTLNPAPYYPRLPISEAHTNKHIGVKGSVSEVFPPKNAALFISVHVIHVSL